MNTALFIGRFQPFHNGHLSVWQDICNNLEVDQIIIGIGSSQYADTEDNPYSIEIREQMIKLVGDNEMANCNKKYTIVPIPDIHDNNNWVNHVKNIVGDFNLVYTGNELVAKLFKEKKYSVEQVKMQTGISGTKIREMIKNNDQSWKENIPSSTINLL